MLVAPVLVAPAWTPILEGELAAAASFAIHDIAVAVAAAPTAAPADRTLFWAYATDLIDEPFAHAAYAAAFDDLIATLREGVTSAGLHDGGLAGLGFTLAHVLGGGAEDELAVIDEALLGALADRWEGSLDLAHGVVGLGVYFIERLQQNPQAALAADGLDRVLRLLERTSIRTNAGVTWLTVSSDAEYPDGFHDCGVAHGVPGTIGFLSRVRRVVRDCRARGLCSDATRWLRAQQNAPGFGVRFPTKIPPLSANQFERFSRLGTDPGIAPRIARASWCYGDPGVAAATWLASPDLARETALACSTRDASSYGAREASLGHGAAGLAHLSNRFYQATGDATHARAARTWFARCLELPVAGEGLVEGSIGVALSLIAAITPSEPSWDRLLLSDCEPVS